MKLTYKLISTIGQYLPENDPKEWASFKLSFSRSNSGAVTHSFIDSLTFVKNDAKYIETLFNNGLNTTAWFVLFNENIEIERYKISFVDYKKTFYTNNTGFEITVSLISSGVNEKIAAREDYEVNIYEGASVNGSVVSQGKDLLIDVMPVARKLRQTTDLDLLDAGTTHVYVPYGGPRVACYYPPLYVAKDVNSLFNTNYAYTLRNESLDPPFLCRSFDNVPFVFANEFDTYEKLISPTQSDNPPLNEIRVNSFALNKGDKVVFTHDMYLRLRYSYEKPLEPFEYGYVRAWQCYMVVSNVKDDSTNTYPVKLWGQYLIAEHYGNIHSGDYDPCYKNTTSPYYFTGTHTIDIDDDDCSIISLIILENPTNLMDETEVFAHIFMKTLKTTIEFQTKGTQELATFKALRVSDAFKVITENITDNVNTFASDYFTTSAGKNMCITKGSWLRNSDDTDKKVWKMAYKKLFDNMNACFATGQIYEQNKLRIEGSNKVYDTSKITDLQNWNNLIEQFTSEYSYSNLKFGSTKGTTEKCISTLPHCLTKYQTGINYLNGTLEKTTEFITNPDLFELCRRDTGADSSDYDDDIFLFEIKNESHLGFFYELELTAMSDVFDPTTVFNVNLTPVKMMLNHSHLISTCLWNSGYNTLLFVSNENDSKAGWVSGIYTFYENTSYPITFLNSKKFIPLTAEIDLPFTQPIINSIKENGNGLFRLTIDNIRYYAYLVEGSGNMTKENEGKLKLILCQKL